MTSSTPFTTQPLGVKVVIRSGWRLLSGCSDVIVGSGVVSGVFWHHRVCPDVMGGVVVGVSGHATMQCPCSVLTSSCSVLTSWWGV